MRILILTHPRSGGFSLLAWLSAELGMLSYHEPLMDTNLSHDIWNSEIVPCVIIKEHISRLEDVGLDISEIIKGFDKVIFHTRRDLHAAGISRAKQRESGDSHEIYHIDASWEGSHSHEIEKASREISNHRDSILSHASECEIPHIITTYCGIYQELTDIPLITKFLGMGDPQWLSIIHPSRRLQNGNPNSGPPRIKIKLI